MESLGVFLIYGAPPRPQFYPPLTAANSRRKQERPEQLGVGTDILFWGRSPPPSLNSPSLYLFSSPRLIFLSPRYELRVQDQMSVA